MTRAVKFGHSTHEQSASAKVSTGRWDYLSVGHQFKWELQYSGSHPSARACWAFARGLGVVLRFYVRPLWGSAEFLLQVFRAIWEFRRSADCLRNLQQKGPDCTVDFLHLRFCTAAHRLEWKEIWAQLSLMKTLGRNLICVLCLSFNTAASAWNIGGKLDKKKKVANGGMPQKPGTSPFQGCKKHPVEVNTFKLGILVQTGILLNERVACC